MHDRDQVDPVQLLQLARAGETDALGRLLEQCRGYLTLLARVSDLRPVSGLAPHRERGPWPDTASDAVRLVRANEEVQGKKPDSITAATSPRN